MIRKWYVLPLLATTLMVSLHSHEDEEFFFALSDNGQTEPAQNAAPQPKSSYPSQTSSGEMFASAAAPLNSSWGGWQIELMGEWLFWKAREEGLEYGVHGYDFNPNPLTEKIKGKTSNFSPDYHSGYRLGVTFLLPYDHWDIQFLWTRYKHDTNSSIPEKDGEVVWPLYLDDSIKTYTALSAKGRWNLDFNTLDVELGRSFFVGKHLSVRPFLGFQGAWIEQNLHLVYKDFSGTPPTFSTPKITENNYNNFQGYGIRAGIDSKWPIYWGLSLYGNFSYGLLSSVLHTSQFAKNGDSTPRSHLKDRLSLTTQNFQISGGINWEYLFCNERFSINLHAGWEEQVWLDQNQLKFFYGAATPAPSSVGRTINQGGTLSLSGWVFGAKFGF